MISKALAALQETFAEIASGMRAFFPRAIYGTIWFMLCLGLPSYLMAEPAHSGKNGWWALAGIALMIFCSIFLPRLVKKLTGRNAGDWFLGLNSNPKPSAKLYSLPSGKQG
jgi:hypothetical protein